MKSKIDGDALATSATSATSATIKLPAPSSYDEARDFAHSWLETVKQADEKGWQVNFKIIWNSDGGFEFAVIEKKYVGFDLQKNLEEALEILQFEKPLKADVRSTLLNLVWDKQTILNRKLGRPSGSPWAGEIRVICDLLATSGFALSRNETSPPTSGFDAIAEVMRNLQLKPNSYSGVANTYYEFKKANGLS